MTDLLTKIEELEAKRDEVIRYRDSASAYYNSLEKSAIGYYEAGRAVDDWNLKINNANSELFRFLNSNLPEIKSALRREKLLTIF